MSALVWMGLTALAQTTVDVDALVAEMTAAVEEVESLRESTEEDDVVRCIDERLVPMRALLEIAQRARAASAMAESDGKADLEARKVMVAAIRQEGLLLLARQCFTDEETIVVADCPECPVEDPTQDTREPDEVPPNTGDTETPPGSPYE